MTTHDPAALEAENQQMREALKTIRDTFRRDMDLGYRTNDKVFAVTIAAAGMRRVSASNMIHNVGTTPLRIKDDTQAAPDPAALAKAEEILDRHFTAGQKTAPFYGNIARDIAAALAPASAPQGFVLVPMEPTEEMLAAAGYADATEDGKDYIRMRYRLMLAAAPTP